MLCMYAERQKLDCPDRTPGTDPVVVAISASARLEAASRRSRALFYYIIELMQ